MFPDSLRRAERGEIPRAAAGFVPDLSAYATKMHVSLVLAIGVRDRDRAAIILLRLEGVGVEAVAAS